MRGRVLSMPGPTGPGIISGHDGQRYRFAPSDLRNAPPAAGDEVDFEIGAGEAKEIYTLAANTPPRALAAKRDWTQFYLSPSGRISRREYWLYGFLVTSCVGLLTGWIPILGVIVSLVLSWSGIVLGIKRFHDIGRSGWWSLIAIPPMLLTIFSTVTNPNHATLTLLLGLITMAAMLWVFFGVLVRRGNEGPNQFGPDPMHPGID